MEDLNLKDQKKAIAREAGIFLKQEFGFPAESVNVMMENTMVLICAENFLCLAEQKMGLDKQDADLVNQMYVKIFDCSKEFFVDRIHQITGRNVISSQIGINFETKSFLMTLFLL
jgi:uncharacterized protein YbcI